MLTFGQRGLRGVGITDVKLLNVAFSFLMPPCFESQVIGQKGGAVIRLPGGVPVHSYRAALLLRPAARLPFSILCQASRMLVFNPAPLSRRDAHERHHRLKYLTHTVMFRYARIHLVLR